MKADIVATTKVVREMFAGGRRTVSILDLARHFEKEYDTRWMRRCSEHLSLVADALDEDGLSCVPVNARCVRHYSEDPVSDPTTAMTCVVLASGGKHAVGIRRALPDDMVRLAHRQSLARLATGGIAAAVRDIRQDARSGAVPEVDACMALEQIGERVGRALTTAAQPEQQVLPASELSLT